MATKAKSGDMPTQPTLRVFKTRKFARESRKRGISDPALWHAILQVEAAPSRYSLGGAVFKKRLNDNRDRAIVVARRGQYWFYVHLFRKSDQANITELELRQFKNVALELDKLTGQDLQAATVAGVFEEIVDGDIT